MTKLSGLIAIAFLCVTMASADEFCHGAILRTASRFRGTIRSVALLSRGAENLNVVDPDPQFAAAIDVEGGERLMFAIHSPSRTFQSSEKLVGRSFDLEAERMDCNGAFWSFIELRRRPPARMVETFEGSLEVGHSYRAKAKWIGESLQIDKALHLPMHHDGAFNLTNAGEFSTNPEQLREIVFEVVALRITATGEQRWLSAYDAKIISRR